jgi:hypothetical protein
MTEKDRLALFKERFKRLFFAMAQQEGRVFAEGFMIGWLAYLARYDYSVVQKLEYLEKKYGISTDDE